MALLPVLLASAFVHTASAADLSSLHRKLWACTDQPTGTDACIAALSAEVANQSDSVRMVFGSDSMIGETPSGILMLAKINFEPFRVEGLAFLASEWKIYVVIPTGSAAWTAWKANELEFGVAQPLTLRGQYRGFVPSPDCPIGVSAPCVMMFAVTSANPVQ